MKTVVCGFIFGSEHIFYKLDKCCICGRTIKEKPFVIIYWMFFHVHCDDIGGYINKLLKIYQTNQDRHKNKTNNRYNLISNRINDCQWNRNVKINFIFLRPNKMSTSYLSSCVLCVLPSLIIFVVFRQSLEIWSKTFYF